MDSHGPDRTGEAGLRQRRERSRSVEPLRWTSQGKLGFRSVLKCPRTYVCVVVTQAEASTVAPYGFTRP